MTTHRVLVVDDEPDMVENCARILKRAGYQCLAATDPHRALALVDSERPDLLLTDLKMPGMDGMELLRRAHEVDPALPVILITAFASIESAVAAIKDGAFDYLPKNFSVDQLRVAVERGLRQRELRARESKPPRAASGDARVRESHRAQPGDDEGVRTRAQGGALGRQHPGARRVRHRQRADRARGARQQPRAAQPFVPVDCASSPSSSSNPSCSVTRRARSRAP